MPTKLILHGGFNKARGPVHENDEFFSEVLKDTHSEVKLLLVYFAERDEMVEARTEQDKEQFLKNSNGKTIEFRVASESSFETDCAWADAIYLHGGRTVKLMSVLEQYPDIKKLFAGKIVAGDSAGANVLAKYFYSKKSKTIGRGLGLLNFKIVSHYEDGTANPLAETEPLLETLLLHEYETKVFVI